MLLVYFFETIIIQFFPAPVLALFMPCEITDYYVNWTSVITQLVSAGLITIPFFLIISKISNNKTMLIIDFIVLSLISFILFFISPVFVTFVGTRINADILNSHQDVLAAWTCLKSATEFCNVFLYVPILLLFIVCTMKYENITQHN